MRQIITSIFFRNRNILWVIFVFLTCFYYFSFNNFSNAIGDDDTLYFAENINGNFGTLYFHNFHSTFFTILSWGITSFFKSLGVAHWNSINTLRLLSSLSGALGIIFLIQVLKQCKAPRFAVYIFSFFLASSLHYWVNSANGETYIPGLAMAIMNVYYALCLFANRRKRKRFNILILGCLTFIAIGVRIDNFILLPLVIFIIWNAFNDVNLKEQISYALLYVGTSIVLIVAGYAMLYLTLSPWQKSSNDVFQSAHSCHLPEYGGAILATFGHLFKDFTIISELSILVFSLFLVLCILSWTKVYTLPRNRQQILKISIFWMCLYFVAYSLGACHEPEVRAFYNYVPIIVMSVIGYTHIVSRFKGIKSVVNILLIICLVGIFAVNYRHIEKVCSDSYYRCVRFVIKERGQDRKMVVINPDMARIGKYYFPHNSNIVTADYAEDDFTVKFSRIIEQYKNQEVLVVLEEPKEAFFKRYDNLFYAVQSESKMKLWQTWDNNSFYIYMMTSP